MNKLNEAKTIVKSLLIHAFDVTVVNLTLNFGAILNIGFYDDNNFSIGGGSLSIIDDDYKQWKDDDNYIIEYVIKNFDKIILM
jgi:hypothetical protein